MKKIAFNTLGCKVNLYDTEAMAELFEEKGYQRVDFNDIADIYLINTCSVTNFGDKKSRQMIRRAKKLNPNSIVIAAGCYAQTAPIEIAKTEGINIIIGTKNRSEIVDIVENYNPKDGILNKVSNIMKEKEFEPLSINKLENRTRAYLKIQEGCNRFCTYCIIPYARGPVRSRKPDDIINEVKRLAENGFKEVVLTGIHIASYGIDLEDMNFIKIIKLVHKIDGIERIRFSSVEPNIITDEFIEEMSRLEKVCRHYHLSLQSGCNNTLKRMNRRYTAEQYFEAAEKLKKAFPDVALTTDIIVGFPEETNEDFIESAEFAKKVGFAKIHVFPYSPKKGTPAEKMKQHSNETKAQRSHELIKISNQLEYDFKENFRGKVMPVLFENNIGNNIYEGYTSNYIMVHAQSDEDISNKIIDVVMGESHTDYSDGAIKQK